MDDLFHRIHKCEEEVLRLNQLKLTLCCCLALAVMVLAVSHAAAKEKPFAGTTLNFLMISGHKAGLEEKLPAFEKETGIQVKIIPVSMPDLYTKLNTEFAAQGNAYDITEMMWAAAQGYARAGYLYELDDFMEKYAVDVKEFTSVYVDHHMIQYPQTPAGKFICLPHQADIQILAYRKDLFENKEEQKKFKAEYGYDLTVPETFDQFVDVAEFFTRDTNGDGKNDLFGTTVMGKNFPSLVGDITPYLRGFKGDWIKTDFHPTINSPESIAAIQYYVDLYAKHKVTPPGADTYSWEEETADFQNNKLAMMIIWPGQVVALEDPASSKAAGNIGYAVVPGKAPAVGGWAVSIPKTAKNPEASFLFLNWLTSTQIALERARRTGFSTASQALFNDPIMQKKFSYLSAFKASLPYGRGWPQIGEFTSIWQIGAQELSRVFAGEITVKKAADKMQERLDQLMQDGGYY